MAIAMCTVGLIFTTWKIGANFLMAKNSLSTVVSFVSFHGVDQKESVLDQYQIAGDYLRGPILWKASLQSLFSQSGMQSWNRKSWTDPSQNFTWYQLAGPKLPVIATADKCRNTYFIRLVLFPDSAISPIFSTRVSVLRLIRGTI